MLWRQTKNETKSILQEYGQQATTGSIRPYTSSNPPSPLHLLLSPFSLTPPLIPLITYTSSNPPSSLTPPLIPSFVTPPLISLLPIPPLIPLLPYTSSNPPPPLDLI